MMTHSNIGRTVRGYRLFRTVLSMGVLCIGLLGFNASAMAAVTAKMTSPVANATAAEPGSFVLTATATSTGGTIKNVAFYSGTTLLNTDTTSPYTFTWNNVAAGTYVLKAKATDSKNATATSTTVTVTVTKVVKAYYIDVDHLNTPRAVTNSTGTAVWTWDNVDPYGANVPNENPGGLGAFAFNLRFPGQYFDKETSTHYNYFRDYDPAVGRYVESDLIGLDGGVNTYSYVENNPLSYVDPYGLWSWRDINPYKVIKELVCKANEGYEKAAEENQAKADEAWKKNNKTIEDGYNADVASCMYQSTDVGNSSNFCPSDSKSKFQACLERANADRKKREDENWVWYSNGFSRQKSPAENASSTVSSICEIL